MPKLKELQRADAEKLAAVREANRASDEERRKEMGKMAASGTLYLSPGKAQELSQDTRVGTDEMGQTLEGTDTGIEA